MSKTTSVELQNVLCYIQQSSRMHYKKIGNDGNTFIYI